MKIYFYNTLTKRKEEFKSIKPGRVGLYTCGPTVYNYAHLGNLRTYLFEDILRRTLEYNGYQVKQVMNITDVGHLTSDADTGEDKVEKTARQEKKTAWEIIRFYTQTFKQDLADLNIKEPHFWVKATDHIKEQIALVKKLETRGFTYKTEDGIYFDTSLFKDYGFLARLDLKGLKAGARIKMRQEKKNPTDFALWKFSYPGGRSFDYAQDDAARRRQMEWNSPWGKGFPGWHLECSAMSTKYLGQPFDLHTGGVDHVPVHHTNEIAQSTAAWGKKLANFWLHGEFLIIKDKKMAKAKGNFITLKTVIEKGFNPLAYRYLVLTAHYRSKLNFSWQSLSAASTALKNLYHEIAELGEPKVGCAEFEQEFFKAINNDLDTPKALAIMRNLLRSSYPDGTKKRTILKFDGVLGLGFDAIKKEKLIIPSKVKELLNQRGKARTQNDFKKADELRKEIEREGFEVQDTKKTSKLVKI